MRLLRHALLASLGAMVFIAAPSAALAAPAATVVAIQNFAFSPATLTVKAGTTVTWKNLDDEVHTVVGPAGAFRSAGLDQGDAYAFRFDKPGVYKYRCSLHPKMMAVVIVQ